MKRISDLIKICETTVTWCQYLVIDLACQIKKESSTDVLKNIVYQEQICQSIDLLEANKQLLTNVYSPSVKGITPYMLEVIEEIALVLETLCRWIVSKVDENCIEARITLVQLNALFKPAR